MKNKLSFMLSSLLLLTVLVSCGQNGKAKSPRKQAEGKVNETNISIDYGAPSVRERKIWGDLEKYNKVWRAGANECTTISFDKNVKLNGQSIKPGKYAFFIIPKKSGNWIALFNSDYKQWGAYDYDEKKDVLRLEIEPYWSSSVQEQLVYKVENNNIIFSWEKAALKIEITE